MTMPADKIVLFQELAVKVNNLKAAGRVVVQSHGVFDLVHPGTVRHLTEARAQGDALVVTVIKDKDVRRGPGRPIFDEKQRALTVASLAMVDWVALVDDDVPFACVKALGPSIFARGKEHAERDASVDRRILAAEKHLRVVQTDGFSFSSSRIINTLLDVYPEETRTYLNTFAKKHSAADITRHLEAARNQKVLLIGDGIIDEYYFCDTLGKSSKSQIIVHKYLAHEDYVGGVFAVANHLAGLCEKIDMISVLGERDPREQFVRDNLKEQVTPLFFSRADAPTITKRRYLNNNTRQKIFEINHINDDAIPQELAARIEEHLVKVLPGYDLVMVTDFGHGLITPAILGCLEHHAKRLAVNAQTNGANTGFNFITRYDNIMLACVDAPEARLATQLKHAPMDEVARVLSTKLACDHLVITLGREGAIATDRDGAMVRTPALATKVVDTVGAGDALFAYVAPGLAAGMPLDVVSFIGNSVGALAVGYMCNKKSIDPRDVSAFAQAVLAQ
jgi:cytidyltransferase-like protein